MTNRDRDRASPSRCGHLEWSARLWSADPRSNRRCSTVYRSIAPVMFQGQVELKRRSATLGLHGDSPAVIVNDALADGEPQAQTSLFVRGIERLKDFRQIIGGNAESRIRHRD